MSILNNSKNANYKYIYIFPLVSKVPFQNGIAEIILPHCVAEMRNAEAIKEDCEFIQCISTKGYIACVFLKNSGLMALRFTLLSVRVAKSMLRS